MARRNGKFGARLRLWFFLLVLAGLVFAGFGAFRSGAAPQLEVTADLPAIGKATTFTVSATDGDVPPDAISFTLASGSGAFPVGASIDPEAGNFSWTPTEALAQPVSRGLILPWWKRSDRSKHFARARCP